jgi:lysozyme family protein
VKENKRWQPKTAFADTLEACAGLRRRRYRSLSTFWRFGRGWLRRTDEALGHALALTSQPPSATRTKGTTPMSDTPIFPTSPTQQPATLPLPGKWWGGSLTIWGALLTAFTTVAPTLFAAFGFNLTVGLVQRLGSDIVTLVQAVGGLVGTIMTITGRLRATTRIGLRPLTLKV